MTDYTRVAASPSSHHHARSLPEPTTSIQLSDRQKQTERCTHTGLTRAVMPSAEGCEECLQMGDTWVHLRICMSCGHVGCCNASKNKHARAHHHGTGHPIVKSFEPGESWAWCYIDRTML